MQSENQKDVNHREVLERQINILQVIQENLSCEVGAL